MTARFWPEIVRYVTPGILQQLGRNNRRTLRVSLRRRMNSTVKVRVGESHSSVIKGNCVAVKRGGEQPEMNNRSVG